MRKNQAAIGSFLFFVIAPGTVVIILPWLISGWQFQHASLVLRSIGVALVILGLLPLVDSFMRFAREGEGTPAPLFPVRRLVVTGYYRYVRNPMYLGLIAAIVGQALFFADRHLLIYAATVWLASHVFVVLYEEPKLRQTYGSQYPVYCEHVPRWLPRRQPWTAPEV
ncbi:MAG: isoprenylcysteine carboxylmethyltransferase family protein [Alphaproteobacteria bacterium]|nr:isoprenylcysteine carboxylmethyltransferase family protein [Alphaproteobacteria bacterium]